MGLVEKNPDYRYCWIRYYYSAWIENPPDAALLNRLFLMAVEMKKVLVEVYSLLILLRSYCDDERLQRRRLRLLPPPFQPTAQKASAFRRSASQNRIEVRPWVEVKIGKRLKQLQLMLKKLSEVVREDLYLEPYLWVSPRLDPAAVQRSLREMRGIFWFLLDDDDDFEGLK